MIARSSRTRRHRPLWWAASVLVVASVSAPLHAQADDTGPRPVTGSTTAEGDLPTLGVGRYADELPTTGTTLHYRVHRTLPRSTMWTAVTTTLPTDGSGSVTATLRTPAGDDCDVEYAYADTGTEIGLASLNLSSETEASSYPACRTARDLVLVVSTSGVHAPGAALDLSVVEEPPARDPQGAQPPPAIPRWQPSSLQGATSALEGAHDPAHAPVVDSAIHRVELRPGAVRWFKVPLDDGQWVVAQARSERVDASLANDHALALSVVSPIGGLVGADFGYDQGAPSSYGTIGESVTDVAVGTAPVSSLWRTSSDLETRGMTLPGYYLVAVSLGGGHAEQKVPIVFRISARGTSGEGAPTYARDFPASTAGGPTGVGSDLAVASADGTAGFWDRFGWSRRGASLVLIVAGAALLGRGVRLSKTRRRLLPR